MFVLHVWNVLFFIILFYLLLPVKNILGAASCFCLPSLTQIPSGSFRLHLLDSTTAGPPAICQTHSEQKDRIQKVSTQSFWKLKNSFINQAKNINDQREMGAAAALHKTQTRWRYKVQNPKPDMTEVVVHSLISSPWQSRNHMTAGGWWRPWRE